jgi:hypothetical protein
MAGTGRKKRVTAHRPHPPEILFFYGFHIRNKNPAAFENQVGIIDIVFFGNLGIQPGSTIKGFRQIP